MFVPCTGFSSQSANCFALPFFGILDMCRVARQLFGGKYQEKDQSQVSTAGSNRQCQGPTSKAIKKILAVTCGRNYYGKFWPRIAARPLRTPGQGPGRLGNLELDRHKLEMSSVARQHAVGNYHCKLTMRLQPTCIQLSMHVCL